MESKWVTTKQIAEACIPPVEPVTVRQWRSRYKDEDFPKGNEFGGTLVYDAEEMEKWLDAHGKAHRPILETIPA